MAETSISSTFGDPAGAHAEIDAHRVRATAQLGDAARLTRTQTSSTVNSKGVPIFTITSYWTDQPQG